MKKVLALALALVMVLSMGVMAFAQDATTTTTTVASDDEPIKTCPVCGEQYKDPDAYNDHLEICKDNKNTLIVDLTIKEILNMIIDLVKSSMTQWGDIESIIIRLVDFVENMGTLAADKAAVLGAVEDLEASLADVKIPGIDDLLNQLKAKIKAMYAGEKATTVEETTVAEPVADTGSSAAGIAAFAAISVAAAAAYVCTKKSK